MISFSGSNLPQARRGGRRHPLVKYRSSGELIVRAHFRVVVQLKSTGLAMESVLWETVGREET
jgi:hypothetical protein